MFIKRMTLGAIVVLIVLSCGSVWAGDSYQAEAAPPTFFEQMATALTTGSPGAILDAIVNLGCGGLLTDETTAAPETNGDLPEGVPADSQDNDGSSLARGGDDPSGPWP